MMRPRKKDENNPEGDFPPPEWFGEIDTYFYPKIPPFYHHLLRPDGRLFKLLKAKKVQNVKHPVMYGCFVCKRWLQPDQVDDHLAGKTHVTGMVSIQHTYELITIEHEWFDVFFKHLAKRPPPFSIQQAMRWKRHMPRTSPIPFLLPVYSTCWKPGSGSSISGVDGLPNPTPAVGSGQSSSAATTKPTTSMTKLPQNFSQPPPNFSVPPPAATRTPQMQRPEATAANVTSRPPPSISKPPVLAVSAKATSDKSNAVEPSTGETLMAAPASNVNKPDAQTGITNPANTLGSTAQGTRSVGYILQRLVDAPNSEEKDEKTMTNGSKSDSSSQAIDTSSAANSNTTSNKPNMTSSSANTSQPSNVNSGPTTTSKVPTGVPPPAISKAPTVVPAPTVSKAPTGIPAHTISKPPTLSKPSPAGPPPTITKPPANVNLSSNGSNSSGENPESRSVEASQSQTEPKEQSPGGQKGATVTARPSPSLYVPPPMRNTSPKKGISLPKPVAALPMPVSASISLSSSQGPQQAIQGQPQDSQGPPPQLPAAVRCPAIFAEKVANIQGFLDKCRDKSFIGLEYIVEVQHDDITMSDWYSCRLCDILYNPKNSPCIDMMRQHLSMNSHKIRYLNRHFPTIYEYKLESPNNSVISDIVSMVEKCYGRLKVRVVLGKRSYKDNVETINAAIEEGEHFKEDQNIVDIILKRKPEPTSHALDKPVTPEPTDEEKLAAIEIEKQKKAEKPKKKKKKEEVGKDSKGEEDSKNANKEAISDTGNVNIKQIENTGDGKEDDKASNRFEKEKGKVESKGEKEKKRDGKRSRSRSLSSISDTEDPSMMTPEEKRKALRKERQQRVKDFKNAEATMLAALDKLKETFSEDPTQHPDYNREWSEFWRRKSGELRSRGIRPQDYDMKPDWIFKWSEVFEQDFANRRKRERDSLMRKFKLLQRDLDEFELDTSISSSKHSKPQERDFSLSPISDFSRAPVKSSPLRNDDPRRDTRNSGEYRTDSYNKRSPRRSASPWEEDDVPAYSDKKRSTYRYDAGSPAKSRRLESPSRVTRNSRYREQWSKVPSPQRKRSWSRSSRSPSYSHRSRSPMPRKSEHAPTSRDLDLRSGQPSKEHDFGNRSSHDAEMRWNESPPSLRKSTSPFSNHGKLMAESSFSGGHKKRNPSQVSHEISVIGTLRLMSALDQAGLIRDLGCQLDTLLGKAMSMENKVPGSSWDMVNDKDCHQLFTATKERVQKMLQDGSLSESESKPCRIILDSLLILLQRSSFKPDEIKERSPSQGPPRSTESDDQRLIKMAIARSIDQQLRADGRSLNQHEFNALVEAEYVRVKHQLPSAIMQDKQKLPPSKPPVASHQPPQLETVDPRNPWSYDNRQIGLKMGQQQRWPPGNQGFQSGRGHGPKDSREPSYERFMQGQPMHSGQQQPSRTVDPHRILSNERNPMRSPIDAEWNGSGSNPEPPTRRNDTIGPVPPPSNQQQHGVPAPLHHRGMNQLAPARPGSTISDTGSTGSDHNQQQRPRSAASSSGRPAAAAAAAVGPPQSAVNPAPAGLNIDFNLLSNIIQTVKKGGQQPTNNQIQHQQIAPSGGGATNHTESAEENYHQGNTATLNQPQTGMEQQFVAGEEEEFYADFTDEELISLLRNFKTLEPLEQKDLISHMKKLERDEPERVVRLQQAVRRR